MRLDVDLKDDSFTHLTKGAHNYESTEAIAQSAVDLDELIGDPVIEARFLLLFVKTFSPSLSIEHYDY
jgi:hypothetical protein